MKKPKYSEEQIATTLRQVDDEAPMAEVARTLGGQQQTDDRWRRKHGQMAIAEIRRWRQLEEEHRKLKQLVANLTVDKLILQEVLAKKDCRPCASGRSCNRVVGPFPISERPGPPGPIAAMTPRDGCGCASALRLGPGSGIDDFM